MDITKLKAKVATTATKTRVTILDTDRPAFEKLIAPVGAGSERDWEGLGRLIASYDVEGIEVRPIEKAVYDKLSNKERFVLMAGHLSSAIHYGSKSSFGDIKLPANGITVATIVHLYEALDGIAARKPADNEWGMTGGWTEADSLDLIRFVPEDMWADRLMARATAQSDDDPTKPYTTAIAKAYGAMVKAKDRAKAKVAYDEAVAAFDEWKASNDE